MKKSFHWNFWIPFCALSGPLLFTMTTGQGWRMAFAAENGKALQNEKQPSKRKTSDVDLNEQLSTAIVKEDAEAVKALLAAGADPNARNSSYGTVLYSAAFRGYMEITRKLLKAGSRINERALDDRTALMGAASERHLEMVRLLLDQGADVNARHKDDETALIKAIESAAHLPDDLSSGAEERIDEVLIPIVQVLLEKKADPKYVSKLMGQIAERKKGKFNWLTPPPKLGKITVFDVASAKTLEEHGTLVLQWATEVWKAWEIHHPTIRNVSKEFL